MAYNKGFNPDALPMHAEPDQAAQLIASTQTPASRLTPPTTKPSSSPRPDYNKPAPPLPNQGTPQGYRRPSNPPRSPVHNNSYPPQQQYQSYGPSQGQQQQQQQYGGGAGGLSGGGSHTPAPLNVGAQQGYGPRPSTTSPRPPGSFPTPSYSQGPPPGPQPGPSPTPLPNTATGDSSLFSLFRAVDTNGTGQLGEPELGKALRNGDYTSFDPQTVRMMIRMFDHDRSGTVGFDEFQGLWGFLAAWRALFDRFDEDHSGNISYDEYSNALKAFGYTLSPQFISLVYRMYDRPGPNAMSFDLFVQSCISLKRMTDMFKKYDTDRDGYVTLSFEEFLTEILNQRT